MFPRIQREPKSLPRVNTTKFVLLRDVLEWLGSVEDEIPTEEPVVVWVSPKGTTYNLQIQWLPHIQREHLKDLGN